MGEILGIISQPEVLIGLTSGGLSVTGISLWALKKLISIEKRLTSIETILLNCRTCRAQLPDIPDT